MNAQQLLIDGPDDADTTLVLAHGAGAPMDHPFMSAIAAGVAAGGIRVVRFEFEYMAARREGRRPGPDREPKTRARWAEVIDTLGGPQNLVIGGKSMGGRIASLIADEHEVRGLVCLGYPFHPIGKPEKLRTAHLEGIKTPTLIVQGERDSMGTTADVEGYALSEAIEVEWMPDGDHSFKPRKRSGHTEEENLDAVVAAVVRFVNGLGG